MSGSLNLPDPQELAKEDIAPAIAQLAALQSQLAARLITERQEPVEEADDVLLTVKQVAELMSCSVPMVYFRAKNLPFTKHVGRSLRFSKRGLTAWLARRR